MEERIAAAKDLRPGEMKEADWGEKKVLLLRTEEGYFALGRRCTHLGCSLVKGTLKGGILTCPCHHSRFDVKTGEVVAWIPKWPEILGKATKKIGLLRPLPTYPLEVREDFVYLKD